MRRWVLIAVLSLSPFLASALPATAQTAKPPVSPQPPAKTPDADKTSKAAVAAGRKAAEFCANCHGEDGNSSASDVPNLAGQNRTYLLVQMRKFVSGERKNRFKEGLLKLLPASDLPLLATYYADSAVRATGKGPDANAERGRSVYQRSCANCHGPTAPGSETFPRLAGRQADYLWVALVRYRANPGERIYAPMSAVAASLSEPDIITVSAFLARAP